MKGIYIAVILALTLGVFAPTLAQDTKPIPIEPKINSLSPTVGPVGTKVVIKGSGFTPTGNHVIFGYGSVVNLPSGDGRTITFNVPSELCPPCVYLQGCKIACRMTQPGTYDVSVTNTNGTSKSLKFKVTEATPPNKCEEDQRLIIAAMSDPKASRCIRKAQEPGFEIRPQISVISSCFAGGFLRRVDFYKVTKCIPSPTKLCPRPIAVIVASVNLGCNDEVMSSVCYVDGKQPIGTCLPSGIQLTDIVSAVIKGLGPDGYIIEKVTVEEKLNSIGAKCKDGKLVDAQGKEIYFYKLTGCWGAPPPNYQEIMERQAKELAELRLKYTVIEMTCNPSGIPVP